jgi:hypothetical protein
MEYLFSKVVVNEVVSTDTTTLKLVFVYSEGFRE